MVKARRVSSQSGGIQLRLDRFFSPLPNSADSNSVLSLDSTKVRKRDVICLGQNSSVKKTIECVLLSDSSDNEQKYDAIDNIYPTTSRAGNDESVITSTRKQESKSTQEDTKPLTSTPKKKKLRLIRPKINLGVGPLLPKSNQNDNMSDVSSVKSYLNHSNDRNSGEIKAPEPLSIDFDESTSIDLDPNHSFKSVALESPISVDNSPDRLPNDPQNVSYCRKFFDKILDKVLADSWHDHLFSDQDHAVFRRYRELSDASTMIFIRFFLRSNKYHVLNSVVNHLSASESKNIQNYADELVSVNFMENVANCDDLNKLLATLSKNQLVKFLSENGSLGSKSLNNPKHTLIELFVQNISRQPTLGQATGRHGLLIKKLHSLLKDYYKIADEIRRLFLAIFHLYSLEAMSSRNLRSNSGNASQNLASNLIFSLLQRDKGLIKTINCENSIRKSKLFTDRYDLMRYIDANETEATLIGLFDKKVYDRCVEMCQNIRVQIEDDLSNADYIDHLLQLPATLVRFSSLYVFARCLFNYGVESMQKLRRYSAAVASLKFLLNLSQEPSLLDPDSVEISHTSHANTAPLSNLLSSRRGRYFERLVINLNDHLKQPEKAFSVIELAFGDFSVKEDVRLTLWHKAAKIASRLARAKVTKKSRKKRRKAEPESDQSAIGSSSADWMDRYRRLDVSVFDAKYSEKTIYCKILSKFLGGSRKTIFVSGDLYDVPVEQMAIEHYKRVENFEYALHDEGGSWRSLFGLLFFDQIYNATDLADVWLSSQQAEPLDLNDSNAIFNRSVSDDSLALNHAIVELSSLQESEIRQRIKDSYDRHVGTLSIIDWNCFSDANQAVDLASCIGGPILSAVCMYLACDFKNRRSGFPDLILWSLTGKRFKVVEVKGPGDQLSSKQTLWLSRFASIGVSAELCKVVGMKNSTLPASCEPTQ